MLIQSAGFNKMKYICEVTIDVSSLSSAYKDTMESLNKTMNSFGFHEKITARGPIGTFSIQSERELSWQELEDIRKKAEGIAREKQPEWDFRFGRLELV